MNTKWLDKLWRISQLTEKPSITYYLKNATNDQKKFDALLCFHFNIWGVYIEHVHGKLEVSQAKDDKMRDSYKMV